MFGIVFYFDSMLLLRSQLHLDFCKYEWVFTYFSSVRKLGRSALAHIGWLKTTHRGGTALRSMCLSASGGLLTKFINANSKEQFLAPKQLTT